MSYVFNVGDKVTQVNTDYVISKIEGRRVYVEFVLNSPDIERGYL